MCLMAFHVVLLLTAVGFRRNANFQLFLLFLACEFFFVPSVITKHALHINKHIVAEGKSIQFHPHSAARIARDKFVDLNSVSTISNRGLFCLALFRWCHSIHTLPCEMKPLEGKSI
jgi:hypothetical protein